MKFYAFIIGLTFIALTACETNLYNSKYVETLDSSLSNIKQTISKLDTINILEMERMMTKVKSLNDEILTFYKQGDTASFWRNELTDIQTCTNSIERYLNETTAINQHLADNAKQLKALKHDLENDLVDSEKIEAYVATEVNLATLSLTKAAKRGGRALYCYVNYESIMAKADSILFVLKHKN